MIQHHLLVHRVGHHLHLLDAHRRPVDRVPAGGDLDARVDEVRVVARVVLEPQIADLHFGRKCGAAEEQRRRQGEEGLTYARLLTKDDTAIDWSQSVLAIHRRVMGLYPGAHTSWRGQRLKLLATEPLVERLAAQLSPEAAALGARWRGQASAPGTVLAVEPGVGLVIATGGCPLLLRQAQLAGKAAAEGQTLIQQLGSQPGDALGG